MTSSARSGSELVDVSAPSDTIAVYDRSARRWLAERSPDPGNPFPEGDDPGVDGSSQRRVDGVVARAQKWASELEATSNSKPIVDAGCGPGWHLDSLVQQPEAATGSAALAGGSAQPTAHQRTVIGVDRSRSMLTLARESYPAHPLVLADLRRLPFRRASIGGVWAMRSLVHLDRRDAPAALAGIHRTLDVGSTAVMGVQEGDADLLQYADDDFPGRWFSQWPQQLWLDVCHLAGFDVVDHERVVNPSGHGFFYTTIRKVLTVPSTLAARMRCLLVGVNPSPTSASTGVPFGRNGNRFWPAVSATGCAVDRDPQALLVQGIGMTDFSKRVTVRADELSVAEVRDGWQRLDRLVRWLQPEVVGVLGVTTFRIGSGIKSASLGWQAADSTGTEGAGWIGGRPTYVLPNPSGLNAHTNVADMAGHLTAVLAEADHRDPPRHGR